MDLDSGITGAMATLVGASVFSIGFLTTRVHQALHRATDRATQIDDRLLSAGGFNQTWLEEERQALREAVDDQFPKLIEGATWVFAGLVLALAVIAGLDAGLGDWPNPATLAAFVVAEAAIVAVGLLDRRRVSARLAQRLDDTLLKRMEDGVAAVNRANPGFAFPSRADHAAEAERIGAELVQRTGEAWPDAVALVALAKVAQRSDSDAWSGTRDELGELTETFASLARRDPLRHGWWSTHARLSELREDWDAAARSWIAAASLPYRHRGFRIGEPFSLRPAAPQTFLRALEELDGAGRLAETVAREAFAALVRAFEPAARAEPELPKVLAAWLERIARATLAAESHGFIPAGFWLRAPEPFDVEWPALRAEAARLNAELVVVAEQAHDAELQALLGLDA